MEARYRTANGERRYALVSAEAIEIGGEQCMLSFVQDITTRKQVEVMHAMQLAISRMLAQAPAYDSLMTSDLVQCFYKTCSCRRVEMWTTDANGLVLEAAWPRLSSHEQAIRTHAEHHHVHTTTGMVVTAFQTGQPISQHSTLSDVLPCYDFAFPIYSMGGVFGVVYLYGTDSFLGEDAASIFTSIGHAIGNFIHRMHIQRDVKASEERYRHLAETLEFISI